MRNAGDRVPGGSPRRRHRAGDPEPPPPADGGASLFTPAYRVSQGAPAGSQRTGAEGAGYGGAGYGGVPSYQDGGQGWSDDELGSAYGWATDDVAWPNSDRGAAASNAVRGSPPAPGEPLPVYPPGPFAAWNRGQPGRAGEGTGSRAGGYAGSSG